MQVTYKVVKKKVINRIKIVEFLGAATIRRFLNHFRNSLKLSLTLLLVIDAFCSLPSAIPTFHSLPFVYFLC